MHPKNPIAVMHNRGSIWFITEKSTTNGEIELANISKVKKTPTPNDLTEVGNNSEDQSVEKL